MVSVILCVVSWIRVLSVINVLSGITVVSVVDKIPVWCGVNVNGTNVLDPVVSNGSTDIGFGVE